MQNAVIIAQQMLTMLLFMMVGFALAKAGLITGEGSKSLSNLLLYIIVPSAILNSFSVEATAERTGELLASLGLGAMVVLLAMAVAWLVFRKHPVHNFSAAFSNAGFMGIPLVSSAFGGHAVFYLAGLVALLNILQWTYGQHILAGKDKKESKPWYGLLKNPLLIGFALGLLRYFVPVALPQVLSSAIGAVAACNAPVAMFILGVFLSKLEWRRGMVGGREWAVVAVRLLAIPLLTLLALMLFGRAALEMRMSLLIAAAAPVGSNVVVYTQRTGTDSAGATVMVCLSTVLSLVSMPLVVMLADRLWL